MTIKMESEREQLGQKSSETFLMYFIMKKKKKKSLPFPSLTRKSYLENTQMLLKT